MRRLVATTVNVLCAVLLLVLAAFVMLQAAGLLTAAAIVSGSMDVKGGIPIGSTVLGLRAGAVDVGDVVTAHLPDGRQVTHRVVEVLPDGAFRLKGDANQAPDADTYLVTDGAAVVFAVIPGYGRLAETVRTNPLAMLGVALACGVLIGHALPHRRRRPAPVGPVSSQQVLDLERALWPLRLDQSEWQVTAISADALFAPAKRDAPARQAQHALV
jgi:hypothetical protein